jgi:hypothetical protein
MSENFDAYHIWLGIKPEDQPPNHYRLLAIDLFEENADVIANAADRQMAHVRSFQAGQHSALSQKILNEISAVRICLLNPQKKAAYDEDLRQELARKQPTNDVDPRPIELDFDLAPRPLSPVQTISSTTRRLSWRVVAAVGVGVIMALAAVAAIFLAGGQDAGSRSHSDSRKPPTETTATPSDSPKVARAVEHASSEQPKVAPSATELKPRPATASSTGLQDAQAKESSPAAVESPKPPKPEVALDTPEKVAQGVKDALAQAKSPADFRIVARDALRLREQANAAGKRDLALSAVAVALAAARKADDEELTKAATLCVLDPESKPAVSEDRSWLELLPRLDLSRDGVSGEWRATEQGVTTAKGFRSRIMLPVRIEGDYDLLLRFTRQEGSDTVFVVLPVQSQWCGVVVSSWGGAWSGLELIDGEEVKSHSNNPTAKRPSLLTNGREYTLLVKVRTQERLLTIEASLDDSPLFRWQGNPSSLSFFGDGNLPQPQRIGVGANNSQVTFQEAKLHLIAGKASWADGEPIEGPAAASAKSNTPIPDAAAQDRALKGVREIFQDKSTHATNAERQGVLAKDLLQTACSTKDDAASQYAMLKEAGRFAVQAKDAGLAFRVIDEMASRFPVDALDLKVKTLTAISKGSLPPNESGAVAGLALSLAEEAVTEERFDAAKQLVGLAAEAARKSRTPVLVREAASRNKTIAKRLAEVQRAQAGAEAAVKVLDQNPTDAAANLALGQYRCFLEESWSKGLPMLALGDDPALKEAAVKELKGVTDAAGQAKLADAWWQLGEEKSGMAKQNLQAHALGWYQEAWPALTGTLKEKVEKRLRESPSQILAERMTGELLQSISPKSQDDDLSRTDVVGSGGTSPYEDFPRPRCLLLGFNFTTSNSSGKTPVVQSLQPIYRGRRNAADPNVYGNADGKTGTVEAVPGYAVAGIIGKGGTAVDGFRVIFMRIGKTSLDPRLSYQSDWIGGHGGGAEKRLGADGRPVVGVFGKCDKGLNSLGLIQVK